MSPIWPVKSCQARLRKVARPSASVTQSISGAWSATFTSGGETHAQKTWNFEQNGQNVTGTYTFDVTTWSFTGTYVDGVFNGIDTDNWSLHLEFEEDSATGTISGDGETWTANLTR